MPSYHLNEICEKIGDPYVLQGNSDDIWIDNLSNPYSANVNSLVFVNPDRADKHSMLEKTKARVIICDIPFHETYLNKCLILVKNPKYIFAKIANQLFIEKPAYGIHPTAVIHPKAKIAEKTHIGPYTIIGRAEIKENTVIHAHCHIHDQVIIGRNSTIKSGSVIGADGCGQVRGEDGKYEAFPHVGKVIIDEHVEVGSHSCIAKGALNDTIIQKGVVIDSFVQIGHNVIIEENVLILSNSVVAGSSIIKKNSVLAIGVHVCDYVTIEENAHIGPGVVVMKNIPAHGKVMPRLSLTLPIKTNT